MTKSKHTANYFWYGLFCELSLSSSTYSIGIVLMLLLFFSYFLVVVVFFISTEWCTTHKQSICFTYMQWWKDFCEKHERTNERRMSWVFLCRLIGEEKKSVAANFCKAVKTADDSKVKEKNGLATNHAWNRLWN